MPRILREQAADYIPAERAKPYFLMVSFYEPHSPFRFPLEFRGEYDPASFAVPPSDRRTTTRFRPQFRDLTDAEKQGINAAYYTSVEFMDQNVGTRARRARSLGPGRQHDRRLPGRPRLHARPARPLREALQLRGGGSRAAGHSLSEADRGAGD